LLIAVRVGAGGIAVETGQNVLGTGPIGHVIHTRRHLPVIDMGGAGGKMVFEDGLAVMSTLGACAVSL
jgi:hypothetical protein